MLAGTSPTRILRNYLMRKFKEVSIYMLPYKKDVKIACVSIHLEGALIFSLYCKLTSTRFYKVVTFYCVIWP